LPHLELEGSGQSRQVIFLVPRQLSEVDADGIRSVQPGSYWLSPGGAKPGDPLAPAHPQIAKFTILGSQRSPH